MRRPTLLHGVTFATVFAVIFAGGQALFTNLSANVVVGSGIVSWLSVMGVCLVLNVVLSKSEGSARGRRRRL